MDTEIRAMFPAAMDGQRCRFFAALSQIAAAQGSQEERDRPVLTGGTGLAPVKAVIEALISAPDPGRHREIVLYYGARRHQDLYDLRSLQEVEEAYPWLQVIPAVSDEPPMTRMSCTAPSPS